SILKPAGTFSLAVGSLSAAAGIGGGAIGASFAAASLSAGRPISGEPGGSGAAAAGAADGAGLAAGCWAAALSVNALKKAPASHRLRGAKISLFMDVSPWSETLFLVQASALPPIGFLGNSFRYFSARWQSETTPIRAQAKGIVISRRCIAAHRMIAIIFGRAASRRLVLRHLRIAAVEQRFGKGKLQHDLAVVVGHLNGGVEQPLVGALAAQQFQDHGARHLPGAVRVAQLFAFGVRNQLVADPRVEIISGHGRELTFGLSLS